ncbi:MAG: hypothetical protein WBX25_09890 [Rhodomicrobium sp.]
MTERNPFNDIPHDEQEPNPFDLINTLIRNQSRLPVAVHSAGVLSVAHCRLRQVLQAVL